MLRDKQEGGEIVTMLFVMKTNLSLAIRKPPGSRELHMSEEHAASYHHIGEMVPTVCLREYSHNISRRVTSGLWETSTYGDEKEAGTGLGLLASLVTGLPRYFGKRFHLNAKYISTKSPWFDLLGVQSEMDRCSFWRTLGELYGGFIKSILEV